MSRDVARRVGVRLEQFAQRDRLAVRIRNLDADGGLAGNAIDQHRFGLHREAQVVGEARDAAVLHAGVRLELVGRHDRARVDLDDGAFDGELAALLFEQARGVHQLALVDLAAGPSAASSSVTRRQHVRALAAFGRRLRRVGGVERQRPAAPARARLIDRRRPRGRTRHAPGRPRHPRHRRRPAVARAVFSLAAASAAFVAISGARSRPAFLTCLSTICWRSRLRRRSSRHVAIPLEQAAAARGPARPGR